MSNTDTQTLAWHFVSASRTLRDDSPLPDVGVTLRHDGRLIPCESGLHASVRALDALRYAPGPILCRVRCGGEVAYHGSPVDKLVCRERTILAAVDASAMLHEFACWCAERALARIPNPDPQSVNAIAVKRRWLKGEAMDAELEAARAAAGAGAAAWAARAAAGAVAWVAAWAAAWAAEDAARDAEREAQDAELEFRALALVGE